MTTLDPKLHALPGEHVNKSSWNHPRENHPIQMLRMSPTGHWSGFALTTHQNGHQATVTKDHAEGFRLLRGVLGSHKLGLGKTRPGDGRVISIPLLILRNWDACWSMFINQVESCVRRGIHRTSSREDQFCGVELVLFWMKRICTMMHILVSLSLSLQMQLANILEIQSDSNSHNPTEKSTLITIQRLILI